ncbi:sodium channel and clathrin linker 1-like isoform X1 [Mytilus edulis]|uniref:sodium channel and clathrin linker 1-like isoform X1 n=1 Tax=Mytilus edulis TaxID=6550 RepID=UPI0039F0E0F8
MDDEEVDFLKDQVKRLSEQLQKYRNVTAESVGDEQGVLDGDTPVAPWLTDKSLLSPLIAEYDQQFQALLEEKEILRGELDKLRPELRRLMDENKKLVGDMKERLENQLDTDMDDEGGFQPVTDQEQVMSNLNMQVETSLQEKEAAMERWREAEMEIDRLQKELQNEKDSHQWRIVEDQATRMQSEYQESVAVLNREIEELQLDSREAKHELEKAISELKELKKENKDFEQKLQWKDQDIADIIMKEGMSDSHIREMKRLLDESNHKLSQVNRELEETKTDKAGLEARIKEAQKRYGDMEQRELDAVAQVRDAVQMVEKAMMEKEQAEIDLKQREEEADSLQEAISKLINEAGLKTRQEVDLVRNQCNERITKLTQELNNLEMEGADLKEQVTRAIRDKRNVEAELEKFHHDQKVSGAKDKASFEDMNRRAIAAERSRDDLEVKVENQHSALKKAEMNNQQITTQTEVQLAQLKERMSGMEQEFEFLNDDRMRLQNDNDDLKKRMLAAEKEKESALRKCQKEMTIFEHEQQQKLQEYETRLQCSEDASRSTVGELRNLLTGQQRMCARWKEECQSITEKFEQKIKDVRSELSHVKKRNDELTSLLRESQEKTLEAERMITDYAKNIRRMEERVRDSESRASEASKQLARHSMRERKMQNERKSLLLELNTSTRSVRNNDLLVGGLSSSPKSKLQDTSYLNGSLNKDDPLSDR